MDRFIRGGKRKEPEPEPEPKFRVGNQVCGWLPDVLLGLGEKCGAKERPYVRNITQRSLELQVSKGSYVTVKPTQLKGTRYWEGVMAWTRQERLDPNRCHYDDETWVEPAVGEITRATAITTTSTGGLRSGHTTVFFNHLGQRLLGFVGIADYTHVVGWCPWVSYQPLLQALCSKAAVCLLVRHDQEPHTRAKSHFMKPLWPQVPSVCYWEKAEKEQKGHPTLHGKVMVFGQATDNGDGLKPLAVWRGSCNWNENAFENNVGEEASFCDDETLARAYYNRFLPLLRLWKEKKEEGQRLRVTEEWKEKEKEGQEEKEEKRRRREGGEEEKEEEGSN